MNPGRMIFPEHSTESAPGKRCLISLLSPTATTRSPSVTTVAFHRTRFRSPRVTTIPFSKRVVISILSCLMFYQHCEFFAAAAPHADRLNKAFLGADRATDVQGWGGEQHALLVQGNRQVRAAFAVAA